LVRHHGFVGAWRFLKSEGIRFLKKTVFASEQNIIDRHPDNIVNSPGF